MAIGGIKRFARRIGGRLGLLTDWTGREEGGEQPPSWYDRDFAKNRAYHCHYTQTSYYFLWSVIADRLRRANARKVLEIGCGAGQLAALLLEQGVEEYTGLDFSQSAVQLARSSRPDNPRVRFVVGDARTADQYDTTDYEVLVCTEVLEHIEDDLRVVSRFPAGKRCICSVPNFPMDSHVRYFRCAEEVAARYGPFFDNLDVVTFRGVRTEDQKFYLFDGTRNGRQALSD
jgi:SAM-dependent methyltransferase